MRTTLLPVLTVTLASLAGSVAAQEGEQDPLAPRVEFLREHAVTLRTVAPDDDDLADLEPLRALIGDARVVGLGEPTHGDGTHFLAKARLVRFLHEKMGFDVLVWESGMFDCEQVESALAAGTSMHEAWRKGVFPIWGLSEQVQPLFDYVDATRKTDRPLRIAGCDTQITSRSTAAALEDYFIDLVADLPEQAQRSREAFGTLAPILAKVREVRVPVTEEEVKAARAAIETILGELDGGLVPDLPESDRSFAARTLTNLGVAIERLHLANVAQTISGETQRAARKRSADIREEAMGDTLVWLAQEAMPDAKLIVWAASSHLAYGARLVETSDQKGTFHPDDGDWTPMGVRAREALGADFYTIDCIAFEGQIGSLGRWNRPLEPASPHTIDGLCAATGADFLFLDLATLAEREGGAWLAEPQVARPRGYASMRAPWPQCCDAFLFTRTMLPSARVEGR